MPPLPRRFLPCFGLAAWLLLWTGFAVTTGFALAGISRGFDLTDEGSYYLSFVRPETVSDNQTSYFIFGGKLFALLGHNLIALRLIVLAALVGGTLVFVRGLKRYLDVFLPEWSAEEEHRRLLWPAVLSASLLALAVSPPALSYNIQNAFCLLMATGFLLQACACAPAPRLFSRGALPALAAFGALVGIEFFVKFSSSVPLAGLGLALFLGCNRGTLPRKAALLGLLLACLVLPAALYFICFQDFARWREGIQGTLGALVGGGFAAHETVRYTAEVGRLLSTATGNFAPVWFLALPLAVMLVALRRRPRIQERIAAIGGVGLFSGVLWRMTSLDYWGNHQIEFFANALLLLLGLGLVSWLARPAAVSSGRCTRLALAGFLLVLPYVGAFGTSNNINANCFYQFAPWFALACLILADTDRRWHTPWASRLGLLLLAGFAAWEFHDAYWLRPYRLKGGRGEQVIATPVSEPATELRLDQATHDFLVQSRQILDTHGYRPGDDLLVFFDLPGFVFAMGGVSPGHPWYFAGGQDSWALDRMRLDTVDPVRRRRAFLVRNSIDDYWNAFLPELRAAGLNFPEDYRLISPPMLSPFTRVPFEIWMPVVRSPAP